MVIGEQQVFARIREARPGVACTTPITAAFAAFSALDARRLALLTPYRDDINRFIRDYVEARGFRIPVMGSFNEEDDRRAARIDVASIRDAAIALGRADEVDGVFVSCTSLRLIDAVSEIEAALGKPVTSSNHALAWHCLRLAGIDDARPQFGTCSSGRCISPILSSRARLNLAWWIPDGSRYGAGGADLRVLRPPSW